MSGGSGFLPDLASWALRGNNNNNDDNNDDNNNNNNNEEAPPPMTAEELRAQRLARMEELMNNTSSSINNNNNNNNQEPEPMDIDADDDNNNNNNKSKDKPLKEKKKISKLAPPPQERNKQQGAVKSLIGNKQRSIKKAKNEELSPNEQKKKVQRKKEALIKKVLNITFDNSSNERSLVYIERSDNDDELITEGTIAEILATRLSMDVKPYAILYLGTSYNRCIDEIKHLNNTTISLKKSNNNNNNNNAILITFLNEIQNQIISYSATCLVESDLFPTANNCSQQLADALLGTTTTTTTDTTTTTTLESNITFGNNNSFYYKLLDELYNQNNVETINNTIESMVKYYCKLLKNYETLLDNTNNNISPVTIVTAMRLMCMHKVAVLTIVNMKEFLLPPPNTPEAIRIHRPNFNNMHNPLQQLLAGGELNRPYAGRSGPAIEQHTILGQILKLGIPIINNPAFTPSTILRQTIQSVDNVTKIQRQQLHTYQITIQQFIMSLIKGGVEARVKVQEFIIDTLLVNVGANALRPDRAKVSSRTLLYNLSVILLKLCEPFINDNNKHHLIDIGFITSINDHKGIYATTGDDAITRLGGRDETTTTTIIEYKPKNAFIPYCFFLCTRALHVSIVPGLQQHESLLRNISHWHWELTNRGTDIYTDPRFATLICKQRSDEITLFHDLYIDTILSYQCLMSKILYNINIQEQIKIIPEDFITDICDILLGLAQLKPELLHTGYNYKSIFQLVVKLLSSEYATMVRNYNLRAQLGDVLHEIFLPKPNAGRRDVPPAIACDPMAGGQTFLLSDPIAQQTLAPSLLLLYGEVEHTGFYDKMSHRAKIASLIKYLWESKEHRPAFRRITQNKQSFIKFANGIMNETNTLIATVMQKLPEIREAQEKMKNTEEWGRLSEDEQNQISSRLEDNERDVKSSLPLCNKTLQMFGYLNTDSDIRNLFLLEELCSRLVTMLLHVLTKLVGSKGLDLKVDNPEQYEFRPKEMLRDLCAVFALFAASDKFQEECAKSGCDPKLLQSAVKTCRRLNLLTGESMNAFQSLPDSVEAAKQRVAQDEALLQDAPDEFLDEILATFMKDPVVLPSGHYVDRSTITQQLLNDPIDPFNREPLTIDQVQPATELKAKMEKWLADKRAAARKG